METINLSKNQEKAIQRSAETLLSGGIVIFPTDTVYGIGALPTFPSAIKQIFKLKNRPTSMPLPLLLSEAKQISSVSSYRSQTMDQLTEMFWPGPLPLIVPDVMPAISKSLNGQETIAVRCPNHDIVRELVTRTGPVATTSANLHGQPTALTLAEIAKSFEAVELGIDDGECVHGTASTILDLAKPYPEILRQGPISAIQISQILEKQNSG